MCGFFGCLNLSPDRVADARRALDTMCHRGPDQWDDWCETGVYVGHRRLSIRDLSEHGRQPFVSPDGGVVVVVNGEIYNDPELRRELGEHRFRSGSDSEVVLHGYETWGFERLLEKLDGMYALAVYDTRERRLYLAKDRWGKKPLFYASVAGSFLFASEAKAILEYAPQTRVFSFEGIKRWVAQRGSHHESTIFAGIRRLSPGSFLTVDHDLAVRKHRYYDLLDVALAGVARPSPDGAVLDGELDERLEAAISRRLVSDVPIGLQLSGGVDSSLVAGMLRRSSHERLHTFSVVFTEPEYAAYSEEPYSRRVAERWNYDHHSFGITRAAVAAEYPHAIWLSDGMLDYPNTIPLYMLNRYAKPHATVLLTGEGADELLGGYGKFATAAGLAAGTRWGRLLPEALFERRGSRRVEFRIQRPAYLQKHYGGDADAILEYLNSYISPATFERLFGAPESGLLDGFDRSKLAALPFARRLLTVDHLTYLYSVLDRQDRASMGASVETRSPFMDRELVEWATALDPAVLYDREATKKPLKRLAARMYDDSFAYRSKVGFPLPVEHWIEDPQCFGPFYGKALEEDFLLFERVDRDAVLSWLSSDAFGRRLMNYQTTERNWVQWFMMVLRSTQDVFRITGIVD